MFALQQLSLNRAGGRHCPNADFLTSCIPFVPTNRVISARSSALTSNQSLPTIICQELVAVRNISCLPCRAGTAEQIRCSLNSLKPSSERKLMARVEAKHSHECSSFSFGRSNLQVTYGRLTVSFPKKSQKIHFYNEMKVA